MRLLVAGSGLLAASVFAADIINIDPQSGPFALQGKEGDRHILTAIDEINSRWRTWGNQTRVGHSGNKSSPQEGLIALKRASDQGIRYITQGNGSHVAHALTDGVLKYNQRNPGQEILFLNHVAIDRALTNEKCNYWHFRFDANCKMERP